MVRRSRMGNKGKCEVLPPVIRPTWLHKEGMLVDNRINLQYIVVRYDMAIMRTGWGETQWGSSTMSSDGFWGHMCLASADKLGG
jgi:hypothetical protein